MKNIALILLAAFAVSCSGNKQEKINVMTFNIRYDNPSDSLNSWQYRKNFAAQCIEFYDADIIGLQEALHHQLNDLVSLKPQYAYVGVGRDDGKTDGEYSAILYKKDEFDVVKSETFWLAEEQTPGVKGWDAACARIVTWAVFKSKKTGKQFAFFNTHFDHVGQTARRESSKMLVEKVKSVGENISIITGDFNAPSENEVVKILVEHFKDTREIAPIKYGPEWSFHDFGRSPYEKREMIDYIFIKGPAEVKRSGVLSEKFNHTYLSDHNPVYCTLVF